MCLAEIQNDSTVQSKQGGTMSEALLLKDRISTALELGESHFREFKSALEGPEGSKKARPKSEIARDICSTLVAFANADGGTLLVGVEDDGKVTGVPHNDKEVDYLKNSWKDGVHKDTPLSGVQVSELEVEGNKIIYFMTLKSASYVHLTSDGNAYSVGISRVLQFL